MSQKHKGITIPEYGDAADAPTAFKDLVDDGPVPRFPTISVANTAIGATRAPGMLVWLDDLDDFRVWSGPGNKWKAIAASPPSATKLRAGIVQLSSAVSSNSEAYAATPKAVNDAKKYAAGIGSAARTAADAARTRADAARAVADAALPKKGGVLTGTLTLPVGNSNSTSLRFTGFPANSGFYAHAPDEFSWGMNGLRLFTLWRDDPAKPGTAAVQLRSQKSVTLHLERLGGTVGSGVLRVTSGTLQTLVTFKALKWLQDNHG